MNLNGFENLAKLYHLHGGAYSYSSCKSNKVRNVMEEFKEGKLKGRNNKPITNQKQAIAIALSEASNKCQYTKEDSKKLLEKVDKDLNDKNKKLNLN